MSALIPLAKATRIIGQSIMGEAGNPHLSADSRRVIQPIAQGYIQAATIIEDQARAEASPAETCAGCGAPAPPTGKRCAACQRLKA